jgi:hypothetical protein
MAFTESHTVEQMILDVAVNLGGKPASVLHGNTRLSELASVAHFYPIACYTFICSMVRQRTGNCNNICRIHVC